MYPAVLTRPDIAYSVSYLSQFNNCHGDTHWKYAKRVFRYLKGTKHLCMRFVKETSDSTKLQGYVDADWASDSLDRKLLTGFVFKYCDSVISFSSIKQMTVTLSSCKAVYMALTQAAKEAIYLQNFLKEGNLFVSPFSMIIRVH